MAVTNSAEPATQGGPPPEDEDEEHHSNPTSPEKKRVVEDDDGPAGVPKLFILPKDWKAIGPQPPQAGEKQNPFDDFPYVREHALENLRQNVNDPQCLKVLHYYSGYNQLRLDCLEKEMVARDRYKTSAAKVAAGKSARQETLEAWDVLEDAVRKKRLDDLKLTAYIASNTITARVVSASNLPRSQASQVDKFRKVDPYVTLVMMHHAMPELDGRSTKCKFCAGKTAFGRAQCKMHRSPQESGTQDPEWRHPFRWVLDNYNREICVAVYDWQRDGAHHFLGWVSVPASQVLYTSWVKREYLLRDELGNVVMTTPVSAARTDAEDAPAPATIAIAWRLQVTALESKPTFAEPRTKERYFDGPHGRRWKGTETAFTGEWESGLAHGKGRFEKNTGQFFEGAWVGNQFHGKGKFRWKTGDLYEGEFHHGKRHGRGVCISRNGDVYDGQWRYGAQHGAGTFRTADGEEYSGEWKANKAHGSGTVTMPNGRKWDGIWYEGTVVECVASRPGTPAESLVSQRRDHVEEVAVPELECPTHTFASLNARVAAHFGTSPTHAIKDGWNVVRAYPQDKVLLRRQLLPKPGLNLLEEKDWDVPTCFWDRERERLLEYKRFRLRIVREELPVKKERVWVKRRANAPAPHKEAGVLGRALRWLTGRSKSAGEGPAGAGGKAASKPGQKDGK